MDVTPPYETVNVPEQEPAHKHDNFISSCFPSNPCLVEMVLPEVATPPDETNDIFAVLLGAKVLEDIEI